MKNWKAYLKEDPTDWLLATGIVASHPGITFIRLL